MAAHRYWRARLLRSYEGGAEVDLTEFWLLFAGARVDTPATLTSDLPPVSGTLGNLRDNDTATGAVLSVGTVLLWDFGGAPADVDDIRLGSGAAIQTFLGIAAIEWSDDGLAWVPALTSSHEHVHWYAWPGARSLTTTLDDREWTNREIVRYVKDPADGRIISYTGGSASRTAYGSAVRGNGVRQFEVTRSHWYSFYTAGVYATVGASYRYWIIYPYENQKEEYNGVTAPRTSFTIGGGLATDVFGFVVDFAAGTLTAYKNGVSLGVVHSTLAGYAVRPYISAPGGNDTAVLRTNDFAYPIAGAEPWTQPTITPGFPTLSGDPSALGQGIRQEVFSGSASLLSIDRARPDFTFDRAARGRVVGTVKRKDTPANVPLSRRVRLYRDRDGMLIRETWSNAQGAYQFDYLEEWEAYTAISYDHTQTYRAVAADNLTLANGGITLIP